MRTIQVKNVSKSYKGKTALKNVSITFEYGKIYGLLGKEGAGKSTLINIITNRIFADEGEVLIDGMNALESKQVQEKLYGMSALHLYSHDLKGKQALFWTKRFYANFDIEKAYVLAHKFGLNLNTRFIYLSSHHQTVFKHIIALSLDVPYRIFDEPVLGLEKDDKQLFYDVLFENYKKKGHTMIIATNQMEELLLSRIDEGIVLSEGELVLQEKSKVLTDVVVV